MKSELLTRPATLADIPQIHEIAEITWWDTYREIFPADVITDRLDRSYSPFRLTQRIRQADAFLVVEREGLVVGFAQYARREEGEAILGSIYVLPEEQGSGAGTALLVAGARALGPLHRLFVDVEERNWKGRRFYRDRGFRYIRSFEVMVGDCPTTLQELVLDLLP